MKNYLFVPVLLLSITAAFAQPGKKTAPNEKPPTQKEMDDMMKEMKKAMDEMDPADKKAMDSMGIKMPDIKAMQKTVSGLSDDQLKKAYEDENRIVPLKDAARISIALAVTLSNDGMSAYIAKTQQAVLEKLSPAAKAKGAEIYQQTKRLNKSVANTATGLWMANRQEK